VSFVLIWQQPKQALASAQATLLGGFFPGAQLLGVEWSDIILPAAWAPRRMLLAFLGGRLSRSRRERDRSLSPPRPGAVPLRVMGLTIPHDNEALGHAGCALRRRSALEPATPAVPAATEKNQHNDEDYKKCRRVHAALLARLPT
jgi:hypothetical protein